MTARSASLIALGCGLAIAGSGLAAPRSAGIKDPETRAWFQIAESLASDAMEGRDIGSPGHRRAAQIVAARFKAAGLKPAGDHGTYFQVFPVHEVRVETAGTRLQVVRTDGSRQALRFLHDATIRPTDTLPASLSGALTFRGYCGPGDLADAKGKVVICFNTKRAGLTTGGQRVQAAALAGAAGLIQVDDPYFTIEPPRWPAAYARSVSISGSPPPAAPTLPVLTLNAESFKALIAGSGQDADAVLQRGGAKEPLARFEVPASLEAQFRITRRDFKAANVLGLAPGRDPKLKHQTLVLSAHLDGYGYGEPVNGDRLYNGALDDAAYVGTLIRFADNHRTRSLRRSVLYAAFTGEEKGLLGAHWFVDHLGDGKSALVADVNLDQLRPLFPLKILTQLALDDTTLGATGRAVAKGMDIRIQPDPEPERGLLQRADHWPFLQAGVPATGFIFGYEPGTEAEARYRTWYQTRYHRPQDDLDQPMDFEAAATFNRFFARLAERIANDDAAPAFVRGGTAP